MITKKQLLNNELMKEIISIRTDTLWKMLDLNKNGRLPGINEEDATGELDNKGAMFIPGGIVWADSDEKPIKYSRYGRQITPAQFRKKIRTAMHYDNATLIYPDGITFGINLDNGFFSRAARQIIARKKAVMRRKKKYFGKVPPEIYSDDITSSYCPKYVQQPYGARTRLEACIATCLVEIPVYYDYCRTAYKLSEQDKKSFCNMLDASQAMVKGNREIAMAPPNLIICHNTRYTEKSLTGITKILGLEKFGEFAVFTLEEATKDLLSEIAGAKGNKSDLHSDAFFAEFEGVKVVGILRLYPKTTPGKRSRPAHTHLVHPVEDLGLDLEKIKTTAIKRYGITI